MKEWVHAKIREPLLFLQSLPYFHSLRIRELEQLAQSVTRREAAHSFELPRDMSPTRHIPSLSDRCSTFDLTLSTLLPRCPPKPARLPAGVLTVAVA